MSQETRDSSSLHRRIIAVCEACGDFIEYWGFRSIHGRVWAFLAITSSATSQSEVAEALGVSRATVSIAINELSEYGLVRPISSHHHAPYEAVMDVWPVISGVLRKREWMLLETARIALEGALLEAERFSRTADVQSLKYTINIERLRILLQMTEWTQTVLKMIINARVPKTGDRLQTWVKRATKWTQSLRGFLGRDEDDFSPPNVG